MSDGTMSITEHLSELRSRLIRAFLGILATTSVALVFSPQLLDRSIEPLTHVLEDRVRVEVVVVHPDEARGAGLAAELERRPKVRLAGRVTELEAVRGLAERAIASRRPIDMVLVSSRALGEDGALAADLLDGLEPAPYVAYLVPDARAPIVGELMLEGANVVVDPPRPAVVSRLVRRAAAAAGKAAGGDKLVVLSPLDPFFAYLKIAMVVGLFLACPVWLYQAWRFVAPGLYENERAFVLPTIASGSLLFVSGGAFAYFLMFPMMFDVLVNQMMPATLASAFTVDNYLGLLLRLTVAFGVVFELPLALALLSMVGIVTPDGLKRFRRYAIVLAFVVGAFLTPADPLSQFMMAVPLILFYELGIFASTLLARRREARLAAEA
jgi:sec-independent protein translocase protein TatC